VKNGVIMGVVVGSIVVFLVSSIWHMASGLGQVGIQNLPNEDAVVSAMRGSIHSSGLYFFPGMDVGATGSKQKAAKRPISRGTNRADWHPYLSSRGTGVGICETANGPIPDRALGSFAPRPGAGDDGEHNDFPQARPLGSGDLAVCCCHLRDSVLELVRFSHRLHDCPRCGLDGQLDCRRPGHGRSDKTSAYKLKFLGSLGGLRWSEMAASRYS